MPQLFPMNWIFLSFFFSFFLTCSMINFYFFVFKTKKLTPNFSKTNKFSLKW